MKKILFTIASLAICSLFVSCNKNKDINNSLVATATIEGNATTRCNYTDQGTGQNIQVTWSASETFKAYYEDGGNTPLIFTKSNGDSFIASEVPAGVTASTPFVGIYGEKATYNPSTGKITIDYRNQDGTLANLAKYDAMVATSTNDAEGLHFPFKHKSAFVKVTLKRGNHTNCSGLKGLTRFSLTFDECQLDDEDIEVAGWSSRKGSFSVDFTLDSELALNETRIVYIAIPPLKRYSEGYPQVLINPYGYIKLVDCDAGTTGKTFQAGKVYETEITYECSTYHGGWD